MNFHLNFQPKPFPEKLTYQQTSLFIGSCFTESIGEEMQKHKFKTTINPNGILFNPASISMALRRYVKNDWLTENELFFANDCWNSWEHHSRFSNPDKKNGLEKINKNISSAHISLKNADWLFITFGTSFIYNRNDRVVGNCHKQPQKEFVKSMMTSAEIVLDYSKLFAELLKFNPKLKIVLTVSPVRHVKDGVVENNLSKARLIDAVHQLTGKQVFYFPAYELVVDDLRDYRFYEEDLVHPNGQAIDYVFQKFSDANFDEKTKQLFQSLKEIVAAKEHRPFNAETAAHKKFAEEFSERCKKLQAANPEMDLKEELKYFGG